MNLSNFSFALILEGLKLHYSILFFVKLISVSEWLCSWFEEPLMLGMVWIDTRMREMALNLRRQLIHVEVELFTLTSMHKFLNFSEFHKFSKAFALCFKEFAIIFWNVPNKFSSPFKFTTNFPTFFKDVPKISRDFLSKFAVISLKLFKHFPKIFLSCLANRSRWAYIIHIH